MPAKIQDELAKHSEQFSRQRLWQLRKHRDGRCIICGGERQTAMYCLKHAVAVRERQRRYVGAIRRWNSATYRIERKTLDKKP